MITLTNFAISGVPLQPDAPAPGLFNMMRNLGGSVGIAVLATLPTNRESSTARGWASRCRC